jgi:hypothetical protein
MAFFTNRPTSCEIQDAELYNDIYDYGVLKIKKYV